MVERAADFGFAQVGVFSLDANDPSSATGKNQLNTEHFDRWLAKGFHGDMAFMAKHADLRRAPQRIEPWVRSILIVRMDYIADAELIDDSLLQAAEYSSEQAVIARYALGRDYHKLIRKRLNALVAEVQRETRSFQHRPFADSAPILEKQIAAATSLGWQGKNTLIMNRRSGSWFFLGTLFTDLVLESDQAHDNHCGQCSACIDICPTEAIVAPYVLDARRCIAYLTIEHKGSIDESLRPLMGNRVFGCDDCQLCCPWNKFAQLSPEGDFKPRHNLDNSTLVALFLWDQETFLKRTEGSAIRRLGHDRWLRNLAIGLGNALGKANNDQQNVIVRALEMRRQHPNPMVREHVEWALDQLTANSG